MSAIGQCLVAFMFGSIVGLLVQRSRFCNTAALRDAILFKTYRNTKALLVAMIILTFGFTLFLTFGEGNVDITESREDQVRLHLADAGDIAVLDGRYLGGQKVSLADQMRVVVEGLRISLEDKGMSFDNVVKATAFYSGTDDIDEMHANMVIRNKHYATPGPASTGVPIARMADPGAKARIELVLRR